MGTAEIIVIGTLVVIVMCIAVMAFILLREPISELAEILMNIFK